MHAGTEKTGDAGDLQAGFPNWKLWRSRLDDGSPGSYYATRMDRELSFEEISDGWASTLAADTAEQLVELLQAQVAKDNS
ncbi:hypothetical protein GCM10027589_06780 [Actinocorallia lasiicapitis]